ncbi:sulfotransferase [Elusimicrobiota bacterium]
MIKPVFLLCSERSGSNLLRMIIGNHPQISAPSFIGLLSLFYPLLPNYGNLQNEHNFRRLCTDVCNVMENQYGIWRSTFLDDELFNSVTDRSFFGLYDYIIEKEIITRRKQRAFIKESGQYSFLLLDHYKDSKFIYLLRDGRDVALSFKNSPTHTGNIKEIANIWSKEQQECLSFYCLDGKERTYAVHYEDLLRYPEKTSKNICAFLDEPYEPAILEYYKNKESIEISAKTVNWENVKKPIFANNFGKYKNDLSSSSIKYFEKIAFRELFLCGYKLEYDLSELKSGKNFTNYIRKAITLLQKTIKGKFPYLSELKSRKKFFQTTSNISCFRPQVSKPILHCEAVDDKTE